MRPFHTTCKQFTSLTMIALLLLAGCHDARGDQRDELKRQIERLEREVEQLAHHAVSVIRA